MGNVHSLDTLTLARLKARLGEAEAARDNLLAFARGHSGAVASIHRAVMLALDAPSLDRLIAVVTDDWPAVLGIDAAALVIADREGAIVANPAGTGPIDRAILVRMIDDLTGVTMRSVSRGHPCFGLAATTIRAEALVRLDRDPPCMRGLLLLGQAQALPAHSRQGGELLQFLGRSLGAMIARWTIKTTD